MNNKLLRFLATGLLFACGTASADAILFGTTNAGFETSSSLVTIDIATGTVTTVGALGFTVNGLTYDVTTGTLYGSARDDGGLLWIDMVTGAGTLVAGGFSSPAGDCDDRSVLLAANSTGDVNSWLDPCSDDLMSVDTVTGVATRIGESGVGTFSHGLAFDDADTLFMYNGDGAWFVMDTVTGAATYVGYSGVTAHHGDFSPDDGFYYGLQGCSFCSDSTINILDLTGGTGLQSSFSYSGDAYIHTLAFVPTAVPEPGTLALLGIGLFGMGLMRRRKNV